MSKSSTIFRVVGCDAMQKLLTLLISFDKPPNREVLFTFDGQQVIASFQVADIKSFMNIAELFNFFSFYHLSMHVLEQNGDTFIAIILKGYFQFVGKRVGEDDSYGCTE